MMKKIQSKRVIVFVFLWAMSNSTAHMRNSVVATINTGVNPSGIAISPHGYVAYVANNNNYGIEGQDMVSVLNLKDNSLRQTIVDSSFNEPYRIAISPNGKRAYVTNSNGSTVSIVDTVSNMVIDIIDGFDGPTGIVITSDRKRAYVTNYGGADGVGSGNGKTISVVDLGTNNIVGTITVGLAPAALALSPNGKFLYVINYVDGNPGTGTMTVVQTSDNTVEGTVSGFFGPFDLAITPNGKYAYVTNFGSNNFAPIGSTVSVVNLKNRVIVDTINLAIQPSGIAITPDGKYAYVANYNTLYAGSNFTDLTPGQGTISIIDLKTNMVISPTIAVDQSPSNIAISPNGKYAYVTNFISNIVSVIALTN